MLDAYFDKLDKLIAKRKMVIEGHFGNQFLEEYIRADERIWYKQHVSSIDAEIVTLANEIAPYLSIQTKYKKVADVFRDAVLSDWYNRTKIAKNTSNIKS